MSDKYNDYIDETSGASSYSSEYSSYDKPKKKKKHVGLKVVSFILCLGIVGAGSVQVYKFMDNSRFNNVVDEKPKEYNPPSKNSDNAEDEGSKGDPTPPIPQNLPGLFDIAARTDSKYLPDIVDEIMPSVVGISSTFEFTEQYSSWGFGFPTETRKREAVGTGTGIVTTEDGYIVTNAHVIYDSSEYKAGEAKAVSVLFSDKSEYDAKIIAYDVETDLAVIKVDSSGFTPAQFGDSSDLRVGELVIAVGNPLGIEFFGSVTSGIVSALNRDISINEKSMTLIQTDAAINQGNSGGPLLNSCGQVIGINSAKLSASYGSASIEGMGFAIPINDAKVIIDDLIHYKRVTGRPQIGITSVNIDASTSSYLGLPIGIYVREVAKGSAAEEAGIRVGDIIIGVNDEAVSTAEELNNIKNKFKAGDKITLKVYREGEDMDIALVLHEANADSDAPAPAEEEEDEDIDE